nr:hypothetical protein [Tanacetum cinerariifolium]
KNNALLMKNHQNRPTGSLAIPKANAVNNNDTKRSGSKRGRGNPRGHGRGREHYGHNRFSNKNYSYHRGGYNGRGRGQRNYTYHALQVNNFNQKNNEVVKEKYYDPGIFSLWHDRLGHPGSTMMKRIVEYTHGHPLKDQKFSKIDKVPLCTSCSLGKLIVRPSQLKIKNELPMFLERIQVYVPIAPPQRTKIDPQRRLRIYVGYETSSIIRYVEPLMGDVITVHFADCHFNEAIFPPIGGEKKTYEKDVSWSEPFLLYIDPRTKQTANAPTRVELPNKQAGNNIAQESQKRLKCGRPIGSKDKNPRKRKRTEKNSDHDENVLDETQDIKTSPEEEMNDMNKEMSINYNDLNIIAANKEINEVVMHLKEDFEMKDLGKTKYCLGLQIENMPNGIVVHQSNYAETVLKHFNMDKAKPLRTPMVGRSLNVDNDPFRPCEEGEDVLGPEQDSVHLPQKGIRMESSTYSDTFKEQLNWVYFTLTIQKKGLVDYADAGYLSDPHKAGSQIAYVFLNGDTAISWRS